MTKGYYAKIPDRAVVTVTGPDAAPFLQGLITQDIGLLETTPLLYSALLTPQGKYDYDFFISMDRGFILLECESAQAQNLAKKLSMFKLRKAIDIAVRDIAVFAAVVPDISVGGFVMPRDPRHNLLGYRVQNATPDLPEESFDVYDRRRLELGVPDGSRDLARGEDTVADMGLEQLNGVSFTKGCYMGQELTSRMHHRGLAKRGLYPVQIKGEALAPFTDIVADGNLIGEMRSSNGNLGLAMLRHESKALASKAGLSVLQ